MTAEPSDKLDLKQVDKILSEWRQGDCVVGPQWFAFRTHGTTGVTTDAIATIEAGSDLAEKEVLGFVILSQTCDLVRPCESRPFVEVCPLVRIDDPAIFNTIKKGQRPAHLFMPALEPDRLVADLDRVMTVEKPVVAAWTRVAGFTTDDESRTFARRLARKHNRFPFPDDFVDFVKKLRNRIVEKHGKLSPEGEALRSLEEIRVTALPSWESPATEITFSFIRSDGATIAPDGLPWEHYLDLWLDLVPPAGRFVDIVGEVVGLEELTAADYVDSDPLDVDYLSSPKPAQ